MLFHKDKHVHKYNEVDRYYDETDKFLLYIDYVGFRRVGVVALQCDCGERRLVNIKLRKLDWVKDGRRPSMPKKIVEYFNDDFNIHLIFLNEKLNSYFVKYNEEINTNYLEKIND